MYLSRKLINSDSIPKSRVELHLHLAGSVRLSTIWELCQQKNIKLTKSGTFAELLDQCVIKKRGKLIDFLNILSHYGQTIVGDSDALERCAYELCEDEAKDGVIYFEVRTAPHLSSNTVPNSKVKQLSLNDPKSCSPKQVVDSVLKGLRRGEQDFNIKSSLILSCVCGHPEWSEEVINLAKQYKDKGVVGIDIAGQEDMNPLLPHCFTEVEVNVFKAAKELNIHRTVHAGEVGPASNVWFAIDNMCAERIGHGYSVITDDQIYQKCLNDNIHFETCPYSSYFTGAIGFGTNPIVKFAEDNANFSISKDDPTVTGVTLDDEYEYVRKLGLNEVHITRANFNAARSSFLPEKDKKDLLDKLYKIYGFL